MKLLAVNLQNPNLTKYRSPKTIDSFMLGRSFKNYKLFIVAASELESVEILEDLEELKCYILNRMRELS